MLSSVPIIALFAGVLVALLTGIFVFEAFVTQLYKGPGARLLVSHVISTSRYINVDIFCGRHLLQPSCSSHSYHE